jgi:PEP-CTERM motif
MKIWIKSGVAAIAMVAAGQVQAAYLGESIGPITDGTLLYEGFGELTPASGIGTGRWTQGNCAVSGGNTICTMSGNYIDSVGSDGTPGGGGSFVFTMSYGGAGLSPVIARSSTPGNDSLFFVNVADAIFKLDLTPIAGGSISSIFPDNPFSNSLGFGLFYANATCTGLSAAQVCGPGQVGLTPGATAFGAVSLRFNIPNTLSAVPEPATWAMMIFGFGVAGVSLRRRVATRAVSLA